jgi:hypothetical protein
LDCKKTILAKVEISIIKSVLIAFDDCSLRSQLLKMEMFWSRVLGKILIGLNFEPSQKFKFAVVVVC